jgi:DUF4097 and DUF4098 domain-containing protein YvlB
MKAETHSSNKIIFRLIAALLLLVPGAAAQQGRLYREGNGWVQETTGSLAAAKNLRVKVDIGSVRVEGASREDISYVVHNRANTSSEDKARRQFDDYKITTSVRGDTAWIVAEWRGGNLHKFSGDFVIKVPRNLEWAKVETEGGSVTATGIAGKVDAESGGGSIHVDDIGGSVNAETGGGSIEAGTTGGDLNLNTGGGRIKIVASKGKINAESGGGSLIVISGLQGAILETGGGDIQVDRCTGQVKASTGGGSIDLGEIGGKAEIETGGGSIRLTSATGSVHAETSGGTIELNGVPSARAETGVGGIVAKFVSSADVPTDSVLETSVGDITVYLSSNLKISIRASIEVANGHSIHSDFPDLRIATEGGDWGPKSVSAEGNLNGGGPMLKVRTTTGDITFRRSNP